MKPRPMEPIIRHCFEQDLQNVQFIYAHHVLHGTGTFETAAPSLDEMRQRWAKVVERGWPFLVATADNDLTRVVGFAYAGQFRDRAAYARTFETSLYVAPSMSRRGIGYALLMSLLSELQDIGARQVLAVIGDSDNAASIAVHGKAGFKKAGILYGVGEKFGRPLDVVLMQRPLAEQESGVG